MEHIEERKNVGGWVRQGICTDLSGTLRLFLAAMLVCVFSLGFTPVAQAYSGSITTTYDGAINQKGNMFDVTASGPADIIITGFDIHVSDVGPVAIDVFYKSGTYSGFERDPGFWTPLGSATVTGAGFGKPTPVNIGGLTIPSGKTYGIYVTRTDVGWLNYTIGANTYSNADITIDTGTANIFPFSTVFPFRTWNGTIYYEASIGPILNGSFETGDFSGWQTVGVDLYVYSGTITPNTGFTVLAPPDGTYAAVTDQMGVGTRILYQDIAVPASGSSTLSATVYVENLAADYIIGPDLGTANPNQQMRVDIMDPAHPVDDVGDGVLVNLFQTNPGDPLSIGYTAISGDLTPYAGRTVRFRVAEVDNQNNFNGAVDNVRITTSSGGGGGGGGGGCFIAAAGELPE
jgi:hypothetical protein